jgi:nitric oxide dioxygenase
MQLRHLNENQTFALFFSSHQTPIWPAKLPPGFAPAPPAMDHARILQLIHQTAPLLVAEGDLLTRNFYRHLFAYHPHLQHTFNMAHQATGTQARSLFDAIVLFVTRFDQLETLGPEASRIAAKHVSVDVKPEEYAAVGASLLATIQQWLGAAATPEVMQAWELAYNRIAQVLIGLEDAQYEQQRTQPGGWNGFKPFVVREVVPESEDIHSLYLVPADGAPLPNYQAGQFISVAVQLPDHPYRQIRQYSLSDAPGQPYYRITVKREPRRSDAPSALVSNYLHDTLKPGSQLQVHAPTGEFYLPAGGSSPLVLIAGGLGITPLMAMLEQLLRENTARPVLVIHAVRDADHHPFRNRLQRLTQLLPLLRFFTVYQFAPAEVAEGELDLLPMECASGFLDAHHLAYLLNDGSFDGAEYYCCGPLGFMRHANALLEARGITNCHFEVFGPTQGLR